MFLIKKENHENHNHEKTEILSGKFEKASQNLLIQSQRWRPSFFIFIVNFEVFPFLILNK